MSGGAGRSRGRHPAFAAVVPAEPVPAFTTVILRVSTAGESTAPSRDHVRDQVAALAAFAAELTWDHVPEPTRQRLQLVVVDLLGVAIAGAMTPEHQRLIASVAPAAGPALILGSGRGAPAHDAAWLNGVAACSLELDEGNKYSRGHPAAHVVPAVLATAAKVGASGRDVCVAVLAGYEVAARLGAACRLHAGVHPHGTWGAAGAAAGTARLLGLDADVTAAAIDAATGLAFATAFSCALDGNAVRNAWVGGANEAGMRAVQLARAGLARNDGTAHTTLGTHLGALDTGWLDRGPSDPWLIEHGYFKRHASCAYTHPPADAVLQLRRREGPLPLDDIAAVRVETHHLAAALDRAFDAAPPGRLAAMFSIPWVVAVALRDGAVEPAHSGADALRDGALQRLSRRVTVTSAADLDALLPDHRGARVVVGMADGTTHRAAVRDPVGDVAHLPFGADDIHDKLTRLLGRGTADSLRTLGAQLPASDDVASLLAGLPVPS